MKQIRKAALMIAVVLAALARPTLAQEKNAPSASQAQVSSPYPNTADGLKQFLQDVLAAAKTGDTQKVAVFVKDMEIPNYETWFYKTFPADSAKSWVGPYGANLDRNERSMQELFAQLSQKEGELFARKVNDSPEPGKGLEWGMLQSLRQPVDIYFASWKKPGDATTSRGDRVGYFMLSRGSFGGTASSVLREFQRRVLASRSQHRRLFLRRNRLQCSNRKHKGEYTLLKKFRKP